jgi:hypothetical protein
LELRRVYIEAGDRLQTEFHVVSLKGGDSDSWTSFSRLLRRVMVTRETRAQRKHDAL